MYDPVIRGDAPVGPTKSERDDVVIRGERVVVVGRRSVDEQAIVLIGATGDVVMPGGVAL